MECSEQELSPRQPIILLPQLVLGALHCVQFDSAAIRKCTVHHYVSSPTNKFVRRLVMSRPAPVSQVMTGKQFRETLKRPSPVGNRSVPVTPRVVPAFTIQSRQANTVVMKQARINPRAEREPKRCMFKVYYHRGDIPITVCASGTGVSIRWNVNVEDIDYKHYLPLFFEGLRYKDNPYHLFARQGAMDMLHRNGEKVLEVIPQLAMPIKEALDTRNKDVMCSTMRIIQELVKCGPYIGEALVPYYRQILPMFSLFSGNQYIYQESVGVRGSKTLGNLIEETLNVLEIYGGPDAYINIKYMVPTYQSCILN